MTTTIVRDLGELKQAMKKAKAVFVWCNWNDDDGDYIPVTKSAFLRAVGADTPNDGAHGGRCNGTVIRAELRGDELYVN